MKSIADRLRLAAEAITGKIFQAIKPEEVPEDLKEIMRANRDLMNPKISASIVDPDSVVVLLYYKGDALDRASIERILALKSFYAMAPTPEGIQIMFGKYPRSSFKSIATGVAGQ